MVNGAGSDVSAGKAPCFFPLEKFFKDATVAHPVLRINAVAIDYDHISTFVS
jgi:hypothetical protein